MTATRPRIAVLFLGETLLIPHLYPIVEALARRGEATIDCWVATSVHEGLIAGWLDAAGLAARVHIRRAPGYRCHPALVRGENPPLPPKLPTLARIVPYLLRADAVVCAEQTSLWIPRVLPWLRRHFVKTAHGAGTMSSRDDPRRRAAALTLLPSINERATYLLRGIPSEAMAVTGYVKSAFGALAAPRRLFADDRPVVLYAPHWQRHRSSWWDWGRAVVAMLAAQDRWNVVLAPHQRLVERDPGLRDVLAGVADRPNILVDIDSFAMVDGTYLAAADLYLGDTSSQVCEFLIRPRPCVFLNPIAPDWRDRTDLAFWQCGDVVDRVEAVEEAIAHALAEPDRHAPLQGAFVASQLGETGAVAADRAADAILDFVSRRASS